MNAKPSDIALGAARAIWGDRCTKQEFLLGGEFGEDAEKPVKAALDKQKRIAAIIDNAADAICAERLAAIWKIEETCRRNAKAITPMGDMADALRDALAK